MHLTMEVTLTDDRLKDLPKRLWEKGQRLVDHIAFQIEGEAKVRAPVDTGFLRNSIYTVTAESSGYYRAAGRAERSEASRRAWQRKNRAGDWVYVGDRMLEEAESPGMLTALVAVGAEYGAFVEYGTAYQMAQPYLTPAVEAARDAWREGLERLFEEALR